jgi:parallel beta-helix repeat protein
MTKQLIILFIALLPRFVSAQTTYYVSNEGSSSNNGTSTSTTWDLAKVNSFTSFVAGDQILFKKGETFYGSITVNNSGSSGSPITYGAYGTGDKPIISGLVNVNSWTNLGSNIWESTNSVASFDELNMVLINSINTQQGTYPNNTFFTYQSHTSTGLTSSSLNSSITDWTGAEAFVRINNFTQIKVPITAHSNQTLSFTNSSGYNLTDGFGFFITNDARTLDQQNEWYYSASTHKLRIYSATEPVNVVIPTFQNLVSCSKNYITFENLSFMGSNGTALNLVTCPGIIVNNVDINYAGDMGIDLDWSDNGLISNNTIKNCNEVGIQAGGAYVNITGNTIDSIGVFWNIIGSGIMIGASLQTVQYNHITNVGNCGIQNTFGYGSIQYNYINTFCLNTNDAGAIYLNGSRPGSRLVDHNIVVNGVGNINGANSTYAIHGIYLDAHPTAIVVTNNTVTQVPQGGIKVHMAADCRVENNTIYDCGRNLSMEDYEGNYIRRDTIRSNLFFAKTSDELALYWYTVNDDISLSGIFADNIYAKPLNTSQLIQTREPTAGYVYRSISNWQSFKEATASTLDWADTSKVRLVYNNTSSTSDLSLGGTYADAAGTDHTTISLAPYQGMLLYGSSSDIAAPTVSMSGPQNITTDKTSIYAVPSYASGHSGTVSWTKVSGPGTTIIGSPTATSTTVSNLENGDYVFQCEVTQDDEQTVTGTVAIHVSIVDQIINIFITNNKKIFINSN